MIFPADYTITLSDNSTINLLFNTYFFTQYSEKRGMEYEDLLDGIKSGQTIKNNDLPLLLLTANKTYCLYNKQPFEATELDACMWIDELGGVGSPRIVNIFKEYVFKLSNLDRKAFDDLWNNAVGTVTEEDKKKEAA